MQLRPAYPWRDVIVPREHGGWSIALEPVVLGWLVAPSPAAACLAGAAVAAFLARRPLRLAGQLPRTDVRRATAKIAVAAWGAVAATSFAAAVTMAGLARLWPLAMGMPSAALFLWLDRRNEARGAAAELAGASAFALLPAACATAAGWPAGAALAVSAVMAARSLPTILTVRACLRRRKGQAMATWPSLAIGIGAVATCTALAGDGLAPRFAPLAAGVLALRSIWMLGPYPPAWRANTLGLSEAALGAGYVVALGLSWPR